jgi:5-methylthioadenosine/S-adenosylhomocysteine deaminase
MVRVSRRNVLKGTGALLAAGAGYPVVAQTPAVAADLIVRGATILSMDVAIGDLPSGDIHIRGGVIVRVAPRIDIAGAEVIDATDMIAMPGLVETHWHMWNTLIRNMAGEDEKTGYFPTQGAIGARFTPGDNARGVLLSIAEAIESGITTVHNWSHNLLQPDYADAEIEAMRSTGIRGRFSYGYSRNTKPNDTLPLDDILRVRKKFFDKAGLLSLGMAPRGPLSNRMDVCQTEWSFGRSNAIPITTHVGMYPGKATGIQPLLDAGLGGPDVLLIHCTNADAREITGLASTKTWVSLSPYTELRTGFGVTPIKAFLDAGVPLCLSVDTTALSGNGDMFAIMRMLQNLINGGEKNEFAAKPRRLLELATIEGARALGLSDVTGSLTPGKRADLILVRGNDLNMAPATDPVRMIVQATEPSNVDTVIVDGQVLKRNGKLTRLDPKAIVADARDSLRRALSAK